MILWDKTEQKFGLTEETVRKYHRVVVECDGCHTELDRIFSSYKQKVKKRGIFLCHPCSTKSDDFKKGCADRTKTKWKSAEYKAHVLSAVTSAEYRQKKSQESTDRWANDDFRNKMMTPEARAKRVEASSATAKRKWDDPIYRAKLIKRIRERQIKQWENPEYRLKMSSRQRLITKQLWESGVFSDCFGEEFVAKMTGINKEILSRPEVLIKLSAASKVLWQNEQFREMMKDKAIERNSDPEFIKRMSEIAKEVMSRPGVKQKIALASERNWKKLDYRKSVIDGISKHWTTNNRNNVSKLMLRLWENTEYRNHIVAIIRKNMQDPIILAKLATSSKASWEDPKFRHMMINIMRARWCDPEYRMAVVSGLKTAWENPVYREHMAEVRRNQPKVSSQQEILYSILTDLGVKYYREYNDRPDDIECSIGYYSADCVIPRGKNKPALVIECQGDYWHSLPKRISRDKSKATHIGNLPDQYELKYFWEHEFLCQNKIVETLKYWLGITDIDTVDYDLKDLDIRLAPAKDYKLLLGKYHYLPNAGRGGIAYGAYLNDELVAVCVFSPMVRQNIDTLEYNPKESRELSRLCIHPKYRKKNLASYFVSRCLKLLDPQYKLVISYCDTTFNHNGATYKACNFEEAGSVPPDYWYVDSAGYIMFKRTLYGHAIKMKLTEAEFAEKLGYNKVWGLEKLKFVYRRI